MITQTLGAVNIPLCLNIATIPTVPPCPFAWTGHLDSNPSLHISMTHYQTWRSGQQPLSILCYGLESEAFPVHFLRAQGMLHLRFTFVLRAIVQITTLLRTYNRGKAPGIPQAPLQPFLSALVLPHLHLLYRPQSSTYTEQSKSNKSIRSFCSFPAQGRACWEISN